MNTCKFCGGPSTLLCDGRIYTRTDGKKFRVPMDFINGKTESCDAHVCRNCAIKISDVHMRTSKGCRWDSRDLCLDCAKVRDGEMVEIAAS